MKKRKKQKLLIYLVLINSILTAYNLFINIKQSESIKFNERLYDVFMDKLF